MVSIIGNTLSALTSKCKKGWKYDEGSCFFNTKCIFSLIFSGNICTLITLVIAKQGMVDFMFSINKSYPIWIIIIPVSVFLLLSLLYPKRKMLSINWEKKQENKYVINFIFYSIFSIFLLIIVPLLRG